jgi:hypothetical protein
MARLLPITIKSRVGSFKFPKPWECQSKNRVGDHSNYSSLSERPPQPRYYSFDQYFLITAGFVPIFVTLHFPTFATESTQTRRAAICYSIRSSASSKIHWDADLAQAAISGLFAALRARHDADRSVGKVAAFLVLPQ